MESCMQLRYLTFVGGLTAILSLTQVRVAAQPQPLTGKSKATSQNWKAPRTVDGQPDLQGVWANNVATPLQRPKELEGREYLTDQELNALKKAAEELFSGQSDAAFGDGVFTAALANVLGKQK